MSDKETVISVSHVSKDFKLPHQKVGSIKSGFTNIFSLHKRSYEVQHALKDIDFTVQKGEFFGIVGRNGSGKSTLLKILAGIYQPTKGKVRVDGRVVPFIELGVGFNGDLSGRDNVYLNGALLGFSEKEIDAKYQDIVDFAELERFMDQKLKNYSSGMQVRLAFSVATRLAESDVLLIDEVLAVGDANFQRKCFEYFKSLKKQEKTVIFVTHDMSAVREYCDRAMLIDDSKVKVIDNSQAVAEEYTRLFMVSGDTADSPPGSSPTDNNRWGSGKARVSSIKTKVSEEYLTFDLKIDVKEKIDKIIYGLHIFAQDGTEIIATNNRMLHIEDIKDVNTSDKIDLTWKILNVLTDGVYKVNITLVDDVSEAIDWYDNAIEFRVYRQERSTTPVLPPITVTTKIRK